MIRAFITLTFFTMAGAAVAADFEVETFGGGSRLDATWAEETAIFSIHTTSGIGRANVKRTAESWPAIVVRCHTTGLESFQIIAGEKKLVVWVGSSDRRTYAFLKQDGKETELTGKSPLWPQVSVQTQEGTASRDWKIPLKEQYFQIVLPQEFLKDNPPQIEFQWIDFYRN